MVHWSDDDVAALRGVAERLGVDVVDLVKVMANESGCSPHAINAQPSGRVNAVGLIQFVPDTLRGLGYGGDPRAFAQESIATQLGYVERYYAPHARAGELRAGLAALYLCTFLPSLLSHATDPSYVLCGQRGPFAWAYAGNRAFDAGAKGAITPADLVAAAERSFAASATAQDVAARATVRPDPIVSASDPPLYAAPDPSEST